MDGKCERMNKTIIESLRLVCKDQTDWAQNITLNRQTVLIIINSANPLRATTHGRVVICQAFYTFQHCFYQLRLSMTVVQSFTPD